MITDTLFFLVSVCLLVLTLCTHYSGVTMLVNERWTRGTKATQDLRSGLSAKVCLIKEWKLTAVVVISHQDSFREFCRALDNCGVAPGSVTLYQGNLGFVRVFGFCIECLA